MDRTKIKVYLSDIDRSITEKFETKLTHPSPKIEHQN